MSRPESSSSRIAIFGRSTASCSVSLRFFSPPDRSTLSGRCRKRSLEADPARLVLQQRRQPVGRPATRRERLGEHVDERDAGHLGRVLHHEVEAGGGALPRRQRQHVGAVERDRPGGDRVAGLAHHDRRERALAGAVRAHHRVHLARRHGEVDALQDLACRRPAREALDLERAHERRSSRWAGVDRDDDVAVDDRAPRTPARAASPAA